MTDSISLKIREAREDAGLTQEQMAPMMGVTLATMSRLERGIGKRGPTIQQLARIAEATGKPMSFFLEEVAV